jgi:hypothetical protein
MPEKKQDNSLSPVPSQTGQIFEDQTYTHDAVFGEITEEGPNYRNVCKLWKQVLLEN